MLVNSYIVSIIKEVSLFGISLRTNYIYKKYNENILLYPDRSCGWILA